MVCIYFTTVCMPVCIPVCTVCMARNYTRLNLGFWTPTASNFALLHKIIKAGGPYLRGINLPRATLGGDERVDVLGRLLFPRRLSDEI